MHKKIGLAFLLFSLFTVTVINAQEGVLDNTIEINGQAVDRNVDGLLKIEETILTNEFPVMADGFTYIPLYVLSENLGAEVDWDPAEKKVTITQPKDQVILYIGNTNLFVNGEMTTTDAPPKIINDRTYVHARVAEHLGYVVYFDADGYAFEGGALPLISFVPMPDAKYIFYSTHIMEKDAKIIPFNESTMETGKTFIYNNYPEMFRSNVYSETYFNRTENVTGEGRLFLSHGNYSGITLDYIIRIENKQNTPVTLSMIKSLDVQREEVYPDALVIKHDTSFYNKLINNDREEVVIEPGSILNIPIKDIGNEKFFTGKIEFTLSGPVDITSFAVPSDLAVQEADYADVPTPVELYDYSYVPKSYAVLPEEEESEHALPHYTLYSGTSDGYTVNMSSRIKATEITNSTRYLAYETGGMGGNINERNGVREIVEIDLVKPMGENGEITKAQWIGNIPDDGGEVPGEGADVEHISELKNRPRNYGNLGNWGVDYNITTTLYNDTDEDKIFTLYILAPFQSSLVFVRDKKQVETVNYNNRVHYQSYDKIEFGTYDIFKFNDEAWVWEIVQYTVPAKEERVLNYLYALGTNSAANIFHIWDCKNER